MRKKTVLSNPAWRQISWRDIPKTPKDLLIDILVDIPELLEDLDTGKSCRDLESRKTFEFELIRRCWDFEKRLVDWQNQVGITDPVYTPNVNQVLFSLDLVAASQTMTLYSISDPDTYFPPHGDPMRYCRRIAAAIPVLLHPLSGAYSVHMVGFPIAVALRWLNGANGQTDSEEKQMILDVFRNSGHGRLIEGFVSSIHANSKGHCRE
ncbi:uncharacterized protein A1O9_04342 [Exophiala aquamarina CBS 119918]|uniref:Uncharacterized protein n=1 Tax=Exophiala aquamarina CBS 119918 TaxID=1182545 RepID=A0A072PJK3_9EURO|nr:uncharacterized protein A1O9_04342 [Exophiala aquamarina CBS 119918]KEF59498.1 hypothetical protein A1O9_04342 [Exophiala aquamarina CBS 119918]